MFFRIVNTLLECNAKVTAVKESKMTPLHLAVKQTSAEYPIVDIVKTLLRKQTADVQVDSRDIDDQTPLHYAAVFCNDHPHVIKLLLDRYI